MTVEELRLGPEQLSEADLAAWQELSDRARIGNVFHGPDVLLPALRRLAPPGTRVVVVRDAGRWMLTLPVEPARRFYRHPVVAAQTFEHRQMPFGSPLVHPEAGDRHWDVLLAAVAGLGSRWWVAHLLHDDHASQIERAAARRGSQTRRVLSYERAMAVRHEHDDHAERALSSRSRRDLRRRGRRLAEDLGGELVVRDLLQDAVGPAWPPDQVTQAFLDLEASGWKAPDGGAMALDRDEAAFFTEAAAALHGRGQLQAWAVQGGAGATASMALLVHAGETFYWWKIAYDEAYARGAPGVQLGMRSLTAFHDSGARVLDTCTIAGHELAGRLTEDSRTLTTLMVGLGGRAGDAAVRTAPRWLDLRLRVDARLGRG